MIKNNSSLDTQIAQLNILTTEFMMRDHHCVPLAKSIRDTLEVICQHVEIAFFPQQQQVYLKMLSLWNAVCYSTQKEKVVNRHEKQGSDKKNEPYASQTNSPAEHKPMH